MLIMIKLTCSIFMSSNRFLMKNLFTYIKISKDSLAKNYENNEERLQKKLVKDLKSFQRRKRKKTTIWS